MRSSDDSMIFPHWLAFFCSYGRSPSQQEAGLSLFGCCHQFFSDHCSYKGSCAFLSFLKLFLLEASMWQNGMLLVGSSVYTTQFSCSLSVFSQPFWVVTLCYKISHLVNHPMLEFYQRDFAHVSSSCTLFLSSTLDQTALLLMVAVPLIS